ncbi:MAG: CocE/NonD family hydrolase [Acidobacteria bacterium]|nr:CocE/NonD family hydrolase [Acidobacteriota bacterium]
MEYTKKILQLVLAVVVGLSLYALLPASPAQSQTPDVKSRYAKSEHRIPMRDGRKLHTVVYTPLDQSQKYPVLLTRTPYGSGPYGAVMRPVLGPSPQFTEEGFIFVYQDVRGTFLSEGDFEDVRPHIANRKSRNEVDESSDTYDTIDWLVKNIPNNNGRAGVWGISYPGFYATMSLIDSHPALRAVSPQAPVTDWFLGDDDHHNGAFFVFDAFGFNMFFGMPRPAPTMNQFKSFDYGTPDAYQFFLDLGPIANAQKNYFKGGNKYWNDVTTHGTYDEFWQSRTPLPHLTNVKPAVLVTGGWFDAENLWGALNTYAAIERANPGVKNSIVMGPWAHGSWARGAGDSLGNIRFNVRTAENYRAEIEFPFFNFYLKDKGRAPSAEATVFRTGGNKWETFDQWPPEDLESRNLYLHAGGKLSFTSPAAADENNAYDEYISDPARPVPYTAEITNNRGTGYMIEDQRFAARRPDVLVYSSDELTEDITLAGPVIADLFVSTTGTDADFIVKLIDVYPNNAPNDSPLGAGVKMGGFQMLVRAEVMRGKFRRSMTSPEPFAPNLPDEVKYTLQDVLHTFRKGHRIMVQVQSTWFPLVDRNPQKFVDIYHASAEDFQRATHRVHRSSRLGSHLKVGVLK